MSPKNGSLDTPSTSNILRRIGQLKLVTQISQAERIPPPGCCVLMQDGLVRLGFRRFMKFWWHFLSARIVGWRTSYESPSDHCETGSPVGCQCKAVERLTLTSCSSLTDGGVIGLVTGTKKLQALDVTDLESLTDKSMIRVAENCPKLQGLNLTNCSSITDESLLQVALSCTQLKRVGFEDAIYESANSV